MSLRKKLAYLGIAASILVGGFAIYLYPDATLAKCPDDYGTDDAGSAEYLADTDKWTNDFYDTHPEATLGEWAEARKQFWIDNECTEALERYNQAKAGKADPEMVKMVDGVLRDAIQQQGGTISE